MSLVVSGGCLGRVRPVTVSTQWMCDGSPSLVQPPTALNVDHKVACRDGSVLARCLLHECMYSQCVLGKGEGGCVCIGVLESVCTSASS